MEGKVMAREVALVHPGQILLLDWLEPMGISQYALAQATEVPPRRINEIVHGKRAISIDTALRLGTFFGVDPQFWVNLQSHYDLEMEKEALSAILERIETHRMVA
ncbi:HigA family addiction module antidote protein [Chromobacterium subtsugae]|uniref:HigA family addiction module antidote protein n=2 Tax=Chromobacterium TaxID=535 RepID=A0ABS7FDF5_9NEIS|nr:HigA family addiction module antitoxin [Chromobacterium subtsugae]MBW7566320.1 HigA family addiction module antidote protein [Chromobacterium subtsugae]MBW8287821.1 HigA family addiction module antidote protein [Chromobacterium subtsugae]WSE91150.1 HigA family addiction module antitoxin [Chromobacterium subtsugae]WVH59525.1 HigA family addiction module antitoxin [Chromobacterium subtsugae]